MELINWKNLAVIVLIGSLSIWAIFQFVFLPQYLVPECNNSTLHHIVNELENGIDNVYMYGSSQDYEHYVDDTLLDVYARYKGTQAECDNCDYFYEVTNIQVKNVQVVWCSVNRITYEARIESANVVINKPIGQVEVPCYGSAKEGRFTITKIDGQWKYTRGGHMRIDSSTPAEILRESVCSE